VSGKAKARSLGLVLALCLLGTGCTRPPGPGDLLAPHDLQAIADSIERATAPLQAARGAGSGELRLNGRGVGFSFAVVYSRPGWARVDLRPEIGVAEASLTTLGLIDGFCARLYLPGQMIEIRDCLAAPVLERGKLDVAGLLVGVSGGEFIATLEGARVRREGQREIVSGVLAGSNIRATLSGEGRLVGLEIDRPDGAEVDFFYTGHRVIDGVALPRRVEGAVVDADGRKIQITIRYRFLRPETPIDRSLYHFDVPEGLRIIGWDDLEIWRES